MPDDNKHNLVYFEGPSMRDLYKSMEDWQNANNKRLLSANIQQDGGVFCCIALTNPSEVVLVHSRDMGGYSETRSESGALCVKNI